VRIRPVERDAPFTVPAANGDPATVSNLPVLRAIALCETRGFLKALVAPDSDRILGITVFGGSAGEIMSATQIAMIAGLPYTALRDATFVEGLHALFSSEPSGPSERVTQPVAEFAKV
jgi:hypothetical protein